MALPVPRFLPPLPAPPGGNASLPLPAAAPVATKVGGAGHAYHS